MHLGKRWLRGSPQVLSNVSVIPPISAVQNSPEPQKPQLFSQPRGCPVSSLLHQGHEVPKGYNGTMKVAPLVTAVVLSLQFLSLDDISNTSQASVDLKMDHQPSVREAAVVLLLSPPSYQALLTESLLPAQQSSLTPVLLQAVNVVPLTPMSLVPPEEAEKTNNPLFR